MTMFPSFNFRYWILCIIAASVLIFSTIFQSGTPSAFALLNTASCFEAHQGWTNSSTLKTTSPWSLHFIPAGKFYYLDNGGMVPGTKPKVFEQFTDLNGDGMTDYLFSMNQIPVNPTTRNCVYLNTGNGWQNVYKCVKQDGRFYGDCAA